MDGSCSYLSRLTQLLQIVTTVSHSVVTITRGLTKCYGEYITTISFPKQDIIWSKCRFNFKFYSTRCWQLSCTTQYNFKTIILKNKINKLLFSNIKNSIREKKSTSYPDRNWDYCRLFSLWLNIHGHIFSALVNKSDSNLSTVFFKLKINSMNNFSNWFLIHRFHR